MYRGEHHPTDVLGSLLFAALWVTAATAAIKPNADGRSPAAAGTSGSVRRRPASKAPASGSSARQAARQG
jgi:membrane-associated phospholipid phosphatase